MDFSIRLAVGTDSVAAAEVVKACYDEYGFSWEPEGYHADLYDLQSAYLSHGEPFWVAETDGFVVATCGLELFDPIPGQVGCVVVHEGKRRIAGTSCSLERLYVHPSGRRAGLGSALFKTAIEAGKARGCGAMEIWSDKQFEDAHRLYERFGAVVVGERVCDDPDQAEEWGLFLPLA